MCVSCVFGIGIRSVFVCFIFSARLWAAEASGDKSWMKGVHTRMKKRKRIYISFAIGTDDVFWPISFSLSPFFLSWKNSHAGTQQGQQQRKTRRGIGRDGVVIDISTTKW